MKKAVFAGTFDPITKGHEKVIETCANLFDSVIVAICVNAEKHTFFNVETRLKMLKAVCLKYNNVEVLYHEGMLVDLMKQKGATYTVRGVRNDTDYAYENYMHFVNKSLHPDITTLFIPCEKEYVSISSTAVRNAIKDGGDLSTYLSKEVIDIIKNQ